MAEPLFRQESPFQVSVQEMLDLLNQALLREYDSLYLYLTAAHLMTGPAADSLRSMMLAHADEERDHAILLGQKIVTFGGMPGIPYCNQSGVPGDLSQRGLLEFIQQREQEAQQLYGRIIAVCGTDEALRNDLQQITAKEAEHAEEAMRLLRDPDWAQQTAAPSVTELLPEDTNQYVWVDPNPDMMMQGDF